MIFPYFREKGEIDRSLITLAREGGASISVQRERRFFRGGMHGMETNARADFSGGRERERGGRGARVWVQI